MLVSQGVLGKVERTTTLATDRVLVKIAVVSTDTSQESRVGLSKTMVGKLALTLNGPEDEEGEDQKSNGTQGGDNADNSVLPRLACT